MWMIGNSSIHRGNVRWERNLCHELPKIVILQLFIKSVLLYPHNPFAISLKRGSKMMPQYWTGVVRERPVMDKSGEIARYLKWEYGNGTGLGFLTGWTADRESSPPRRFGFIERLRELRAAIKVRVTTRPIDDWGQELTLLAQWKRGELRPHELVDRLEELDRMAKISGPSASQ